MKSDISGGAVDAGNKTNLEVGSGNGRVEVNISSDENASAVVEKVQTVSGQPDDAEEFLGGVDVELNDSKNNEVPAENESGSVRIYYDQSTINSQNIDESTIEIYFYNSTSGEWESIGADARNTQQNWVEAEVEHFSLYSAFGIEEVVNNNNQDSESDTGGGGSVITTTGTGETVQEQANQTGQQEQEEETVPTDQTPAGDTGNNQGQNQQVPDTGTGETGGEESDQEQQGNQQSPPGPTGQFLTSTSGFIGDILETITDLIPLPF